jgi:hypothetical protein
MLCKREKTCVATSKIDVNCVTTNLSSKKNCFNNKVHGKYGIAHINKDAKIIKDALGWFDTIFNFTKE